MSSPITLESVKAELQAWRLQKRSPRSKIPEPIREKILSLRNSVSITRLTKELGINSTMVKSWTGQSAQSITPTPTLVPLTINESHPLPNGDIELRCELPNGQQWHLSGCCNAQQVSAFVQSLYSPQGV